MTAISNLEKALIILGFETRTTLLKMWADCKTLLATLEEIRTLVFSVMMHLDTNIFSFLLSIFLDLIFLFFFFFFSYYFDDEEAHDVRS